ncbi:MAG: bifunctional DNA-formamidopyrimidine glycosylase/DNA-(apurinic or apyrimidinic site) lyase [Rhodospirillales bacterium]|nr:bifunctional DNA-formamidopyrimidine glycosylase/DNA-(apurinic or apyrimidinic site) lyase [Rhodospirillales bacterium]MBO6788532.1 bifunctional DNA-formamidopyrimidine glycosylase/DNA-(apurinic or apyrimidinic site) lyase [Rhodospirillales bacterium]
MPELPEVETVRRGLAPALEGAVIAKATAFRPDLRFPLPPGFAENITGKRVDSVDRRAKYLLLRIAGGMVMLSHLGMSGRYRIYKDAPPALEPHDHLELVTDSGVTIRYNDPRRFGILDLFPEEGLATHKLLASLGPEPLSNAFDGPALAAGLGDKRTAIKLAILDQRVVAGVGNIYASEALFRAGISPKRTARTVKRGRADKLAAAIRDVLNDAIAAGGSSLRDHRQTSGELGYFQHSFKVYGRGGETCPGCGTEAGIRQFVQGGRSTFYCAKCQR